jgi:hypothetical protein
MATDHIRYDLLVRDALRGVVRRVLADVAREGLSGDHHLYISFNTGMPGVRISQRLRAQYPEEMTIVLQHQFWDLTVTEIAFEVGLSFNGVPEKLVVPFDALKGFADPSVQFGLEFQVAEEKTDAAGSEGAAADVETPEPEAKAPRRGARVPRLREVEPKLPAPAKTAASKKEPEAEPEAPKPSGGGEVVRFDRFRKK